jgi:hypothetical protein
VPRFDVLRLPGIVTECPAQFLNARGECVVAHNRAAPDCGEQIVLAHRLTCTFHEQAQHLSRLSRQPDLDLPGPQPAGGRVERVSAKANPAADLTGHGALPVAHPAFILQFYRIK